MNDEKRIKEYYDLLAGIYDDLYGEEQRAKYDKIIHIIKDKRALSRMLDLGCGTCEFSYIAKKLKYEYIGLDLSLNMLKCGKAKNREGELVQASFRRLPFRRNSFLIVIAIDSFKDISEYLGLENEIVSRIKRGGRIVITFPKRGLKSKFIRELKVYEKEETNTKDVFLYKDL